MNALLKGARALKDRNHLVLLSLSHAMNEEFCNSYIGRISENTDLALAWLFFLLPHTKLLVIYEARNKIQEGYSLQPI